MGEHMRVVVAGITPNENDSCKICEYKGVKGTIRYKYRSRDGRKMYFVDLDNNSSIGFYENEIQIESA